MNLFYIFFVSWIKIFFCLRENQIIWKIQIIKFTMLKRNEDKDKILIMIKFKHIWLDILVA